MVAFNFKMLYLILKSVRPLQWLKNMVIFSTIIFGDILFLRPNEGWPYFGTVTYAFFIFCLLTSAVYLLNDIFDKESDQKHPFKKNRPIASGKLPINVAIFVSILCLSLVIVLSLYLPLMFKILLALYFILQIAYVKKLKNIPILDVISIATGFLIRVYAGAAVINMHTNVWFLLTIISASLFLAVGKRQGELTLLKSMNINPSRTTLKHYNQRLLDQYTSMFATATWVTYALFTFNNELNRGVKLVNILGTLPKTLRSEKLLMLSIPFVIIGIMRYLQLIYENNEGESPEKILIKDKMLLITFFGFAIVVFGTIYVF